MTKFFELFLSTGGRAPAAIVDRVTQGVLALLARSRGRGRKRDGRVPMHYLSNNHLRQDIGLPPVNSRGWPY